MKTKIIINQTDNPHNHEESDLAARTRALESLLLEKRLVSTDAIEKLISSYENDIGSRTT